MPKVKIPTIYEPLKERQDKLRQNLTRLSNAKFTLVTLDLTSTEEGLPRAILRSSARVRQSNYLFSVWEDFRGFTNMPYLYGFTYSLQHLEQTLEPVFRYECHPEVDDPPTAINTDNEEEGWDKRNPYSINPHFHPHHALDHPISHLHYPFQRSERGRIVFHLIAWIETDLVKRFYDSGRVKIAS